MFTNFTNSNSRNGGMISAAQPEANASRFTVLVGSRRKVRLPQAPAMKQQNSCAFSCWIQTKTVAEGSPWPGSRNIPPDTAREISGIRGVLIV